MNDKLKNAKENYESARDGMLTSIQRGGGLISVTLATNYWSAAEVYIGLLNDSSKDLETILKVVNEPVGRDVTAELGHVRGLDVLQWLDSAARHDTAIERGALVGWRDYSATDVDPLQALSDRGYVILEPYTSGCHITDAGMRYLATFKREVFGK